MYCITLLNLNKILRNKSTLQLSFIKFSDKIYSTGNFILTNYSFFCDFNVAIDSFFRICCWYPVVTFLQGITDSRHIRPDNVYFNAEYKVLYQ